MILPIDNRWRLKSDRYGWAIQRYISTPTKGRNKGIAQWRNERYYTKLNKAVSELGELQLMTSECKTLEEALRKVASLSAHLTDALTIHVANVEEDSHHS